MIPEDLATASEMTDGGLNTEAANRRGRDVHDTTQTDPWLSVT